MLRRLVQPGGEGGEERLGEADDAREAQGEEAEEEEQEGRHNGVSDEGAGVVSSARQRTRWPTSARRRSPQGQRRIRSTGVGVDSPCR